MQTTPSFIDLLGEIRESAKAFPEFWASGAKQLLSKFNEDAIFAMRQEEFLKLQKESAGNIKQAQKNAREGVDALKPEYYQHFRPTKPTREFSANPFNCMVHAANSLMKIMGIVKDGAKEPVPLPRPDDYKALLLLAVSLNEPDLADAPTIPWGEVEWEWRQTAAYHVGKVYGEKFENAIWRAKVKIIFPGIPDGAKETAAAVLESLLKHIQPQKNSNNNRQMSGGETTSESDSQEHAAQPHWRRHGATWNVSFEGVSGGIKDTKGMHVIAELLTTPMKDFQVSYFIRGRVETSGAEPIIDKEGMKQILDRIKQLDREREETGGEETKQAAIEQEKEELLKHVSRTQGKGGRSKQLNDERHTDYVAVKGQLETVIKNLEKGDFIQLAMHLNESLKIEKCSISYRPQMPVPEWDTHA